MNAITPSQAWAMLSRHATDEQPLLRSLPRLNEMRRRRRCRDRGIQQQQDQHGILCRDDDDGDDDNDENENFIFIHRSSHSNNNAKQQQQQQQYILLADISRHHITNDTLHHLLRYSASLCIKEQIRSLAWGWRGGGGGGGNRTSTSRKRDGVQSSSSTHGIQDESFSSSILSGLVGTCGVSFAQEEQNYNDDNGDDSYDKCLKGTRRGEEVEDEDERDSSWNSSMHLAYRVPSGRGSFIQDPSVTTTMYRPTSHSGGEPASINDQTEQRYHAPVNALDEIHGAHFRIQHLSNAIRSGKKRGARFFGDLPLVDVLVVSGGGGVVTSGVEFVSLTLMNGSASSCSLTCVDSTTLVSSSSPSNTVQSVPNTPEAKNGGGVKKSSSSSSNSMSMASTLQSSTAGGVIHMVTTPFKSVVQRGSGGGESVAGGMRSLSLSSSLNEVRGPTMTSASSSFFQSQHPRKKWRQRKLNFLTSSDPSAVHEALCDLEPATTMVITVNVDPDLEEECCEITSTVKTWLFSGLSSSSSSSSDDTDEKRRGHVLRHHIYSVTATDAPPSSSSSSSSSSLDQNVFVLPRHSRCEAFSTFSAAGLLPLSIIFGWETISSLLAGAHDMDRHFVDSSPLHNLPIMLALVDFWNDAFLNSEGRVVSTCLDVMEVYPKFVAVLESRVLNSASSSPPLLEKSSGTEKTYSKGKERKPREGPSPVIDGGSHYFNIDSGIGRGMSKNLSMEIIMAFDFPTIAAQPRSCLASLENAHRKRICTLLASVDLMAFGFGAGCGGTNHAILNATPGLDHNPSSPPMIQSVDSMISHGSTNGLFGNVSSSSTSLAGNQPSTLLFCRTCDAYTCGQLIALAEHRATVKAWLWRVDPFPTMELSIRKERHEYLSERMRRMELVLFSDRETCRGLEGINSTSKFVLREYAERIL